jgi:Leucine-rich repeat (LRR) protein
MERSGLKYLLVILLFIIIEISDQVQGKRAFDFDCKKNDGGDLLTVCTADAAELSGNDVDLISEGVGANVGSIKFTGNKNVQHLPSSIFKDCPKLRTLEANEIGLQELSKETFQSASSLVEFSANKNQIKKLEDYTFEGAPNLEKIELEENQITVIRGKTFHGLSKLKKLSLKWNGIKKIARNAFESLVSLEWINVNEGELQCIPKELFQNTPKIKELYIHDHKINYIHPSYGDNMKKLTTLSIHVYCPARNYILTYSIPVTAQFIPQCFENYKELENDSELCDVSSKDVAEGQ